MIIITADDYGKTRHATDSIVECFSKKRITSASVMVFMEDSERAALLALQTDLEMGLHINFTAPFTGGGVSVRVQVHQHRLASYLSKHKLAQVFVNPFLLRSFDMIVDAQQAEFVRLYGRLPEFYNGHHHMHLCANMLAGGTIPGGAKVRRTFTFDRGEKNPLNLFYRRMLEIYISKRFVSTDSFFSIASVQNRDRVRQIIDRAATETVELEVHPENPEERELLVSDEFGEMLDSVQLGRFSDL